ncbi:MAG TPA: 4-hydroxy-3-methylbut-2-enyl diphosphate reductase [Spirochaetota bacterium]|nr:4-hydroxy-3-methylbut-2-enyl diphosphate reductase [Spirochaetota bacterium]HPI89169.1 4-hydroxy-3-methylbut-2-enyl diphosphate reductase [Spirochaetota bacterium]HPR46836.1 4-hydroxy-3-methylbut-2-enyl diphosphate reductase [Spirochaetota bacterium]
MKIELARHSGFCMGVRNAVQKIVTIINTTDEPIAVYGPLIHNPQTIDILTKRGLETVHSLDDVSGSPIAIRTHGIPIQDFQKIREKASRVINLTCPRVAKVQAIIKKYSSQGYFTIITGDDDHAEVVGLKSYASSGVAVISSPWEARNIPITEKCLLVSQTTLERELFNSIARELKDRCPTIEIVDTICDSTRYRQADVIEGIKKGVDTIVVVGGKNSANTKRLAHIGEEAGVRTILVETADELQEKDFNDSEYVLLTAGASTPGWIINNAMERLYAFKFSKSNLLLNGLKRILEFSVRSHLVSSIAAFFMTLVVQKYCGMHEDINFALISLLYIFSMYSMNNYFDRTFLKESNSYKYAIYGRFGNLYFALSLLCIAVSLWISLKYSMATTTILVLSYLLGLFYSTDLVRKIVAAMGKIPKKIYNTKIITSFGWLVPVIFLPAIDSGASVLTALAAGTVIFLIIFLRQILMDVIAIQGDLIFGRETIPVLLGLKNAFKTLTLLSLAGIVFYTAATVLTGNYIYLSLLAPVAYYLVLYKHINKLPYLIALKYEVIVDLNSFILIMIYFLVFR